MTDTADEKKPVRVPRTFRLPPDLIERYTAHAAKLGMEKTAFVERALEAALGGDTRARAPRSDDRHAHGDNASATGAVPARGASRPTASPRAPAAPRAATRAPEASDPVVSRADAFRAATRARR